jgi:hypothetical protein
MALTSLLLESKQVASGIGKVSLPAELSWGALSSPVILVQQH